MITVIVTLEGIDVAVTGEHFYSRGATDGRFGPPIEPDENYVEIHSITLRGKEIEVTQEQFELCVEKLMEEGGSDDFQDY